MAKINENFSLQKKKRFSNNIYIYICMYVCIHLVMFLSLLVKKALFHSYYSTLGTREVKGKISTESCKWSRWQLWMIYRWTMQGLRWCSRACSHPSTPSALSSRPPPLEPAYRLLSKAVRRCRSLEKALTTWRETGVTSSHLKWGVDLRVM